jgi:SMP-30/Gluconolactonase/LRE-like region
VQSEAFTPQKIAPLYGVRANTVAIINYPLGRAIRSSCRARSCRAIPAIGMFTAPSNHATFGTGRPNGQIDKILDNVPSPNGLVLNAQANVLYLAVTRANCVWRVRLLPDGTATKVGVFVQLSGGLARPGGLALNEEDGLAIAHAGYGVVWICNRLGDPVIS